MAEALERDLGGHRDRRGVREVGDLRTGDRDPAMMVALLLYAYARGIRSSR
jgi:hypothetical protein